MYKGNTVRRPSELAAAIDQNERIPGEFERNSEIGSANNTKIRKKTEA